MNESTSAREGGRRSDRRRRLGSIFKNRTPLDPGLSLILRFFDLVMLGLWVAGLLFYALLAIAGIGDFGHFPAIAAETFLRGLRVYIPYRIFIYLCFRMSMRYESPSPRDPGSGAEE